MANAKTEHSKRLRAETSKAAMRKRRSNTNFKQLAIAGDKAVIERFIAALAATGKTTRIEQLAELMNQLDER